jgi:hypothetical protein
MTRKSVPMTIIKLHLKVGMFRKTLRRNSDNTIALSALRLICTVVSYVLNEMSYRIILRGKLTFFKIFGIVKLKLYAGWAIDFVSIENSSFRKHESVSVDLAHLCKISFIKVTHWCCLITRDTSIY